MFEDCTVSKSAYDINDIVTVHTWNKNLDNNENKKFITDYIDEYDECPNSFALLGYEAGLILSSLEGLKSKEIKEVFATLELKTPRGLLKQAKFWKGLDAPLYLKMLNLQKGQSSNSKILSTLPDPKTMDELIPKIQKTIVSGWTNPYLCA